MWYVIKGGEYLHINVSTGDITWVTMLFLASMFPSYIDAKIAADRYGGIPYYPSA
jgi:hypothetical protein